MIRCMEHRHSQVYGFRFLIATLAACSMASCAPSNTEGAVLILTRLPTSHLLTTSLVDGRVFIFLTQFLTTRLSRPRLRRLPPKNGPFDVMRDVSRTYHSHKR